MYAKVFSMILDSSLADDYQIRHVFEDLLKLADREGVVDMTARAIAGRTNVPLEVVQRALDALEQPDPESRTPDEDGRRIVRLDAHRNWGWRVVNYEKYSAIRDEDSRREYMKSYMRKWRNPEAQSVSSCKQVLTPVSSGKPSLAPVPVPVPVDIKTKTVADAPVLSLEAPKEKTASGKHSQGEIERVRLAYPLKKAPGAARKAISKALERIAARGESDPAAFLIGRIDTWKASRESDAAAGRFVPSYPYPATWFNGECYDEEALQPVKNCVLPNGELGTEAELAQTGWTVMRGGL
jgi:hypothetical protein